MTGKIYCLFFSGLILSVLLSSFIQVNHVYAVPTWLRKGIYAVYKFERAYVFAEKLSPGHVRVRSVGRGYYRWEVLSVEGKYAVLNVTFKAEDLAGSVIVTINTETMDLIDDYGKVWGKAWFWIDLARIPASHPDRTTVRNIIVVMNWLNETVKNPRVSRVFSLSRESHLRSPKTPLGYVNRCVVMSVQVPNITHLRKPYGVSFCPSGTPLYGYYEAKCGLLYAGMYMDDILSQKFGVVYFELLGEKGEQAYGIILEDTNVDIGVVSEIGVDPVTLLKNNYLYILTGVLAALFLYAFLKGRVCIRH